MKLGNFFGKADEGKLREEQQRAIEAEQLIENPLYKEAFDKLNDMLLNEWKERAETPEERERIWMAQNILSKLQAHLKTIIETGKLARTTLEEIKDLTN